MALNGAGLVAKCVSKSRLCVNLEPVKQGKGKEEKRLAEKDSFDVREDNLVNKQRG